MIFAVHNLTSSTLSLPLHQTLEKNNSYLKENLVDCLNSVPIERNHLDLEPYSVKWITELQDNDG